jgi:FMN reductase (NADPH)/FMN reductase [NAD(P)H]
MNETLALIEDRKSVRTFDHRPVKRTVVDQILHATMRAPTAGNLMLYSIIEVTDQAIKDRLAESCDHQPFIARAPLVLLFLADYQRWFDLFVASGVPAWCEARGEAMRRPGEGDLFLACCDALVAAQTAVIAAESLGLGSCYVGDILEQYEVHRGLFGLPPYAYPITLLCLGYPSESARARKRTARYAPEFIHFRDTYTRFGGDVLQDMAALQDPGRYVDPATNLGQHVYARKFAANFSVEMTRSVREALRVWTAAEEHS